MDSEAVSPSLVDLVWHVCLMGDPSRTYGWIELSFEVKAVSTAVVKRYYQVRDYCRIL